MLTVSNNIVTILAPCAIFLKRPRFKMTPPTYMYCDRLNAREVGGIMFGKCDVNACFSRV